MTDANLILGVLSASLLLWGLINHVSPGTMRRRAARDIARACHIERVHKAWQQSKEQYHAEVKATMGELEAREN